MKSVAVLVDWIRDAAANIEEELIFFKDPSILFQAESGSIYKLQEDILY
jgi:hypothetical protein